MHEPTRCKNCWNSKAAEGRIATQEPRGVNGIQVAVDLQLGKFFARPIKSAIKARICSNCGLIELYAEEAAKLYTAFLKSQSED